MHARYRFSGWSTAPTQARPHRYGGGLVWRQVLTPERVWWKDEPINPYAVFK